MPARQPHADITPARRHELQLVTASAGATVVATLARVPRRAMTRHGNCLARLGELDAAIAMFNRALTEHRNPDTLALLRATEKRAKEEAEAAYVDLAAAEEAKMRGNVAFAAQVRCARARTPRALASAAYAARVNLRPADVWTNRYEAGSGQ